LFTALARWSDALHVLERLAQAQPDAATRAKYTYAGAVIARDNLKNAGVALDWFRRVLQADAAHEKAYGACRDLLRQAGEWKELTRLLRERLRTLPETAGAADRIALFEELGELYRDRLGDPVTALAAYEQVVALTPLADADSDEAVARRRRVVTMAIELRGDHLDKGIEQLQTLIALRPMEFELYHQLVVLFAGQREIERAVGVCRTLRFLKQATPHEMELAARGETGAVPQARGTVSRELWRGALYHAGANPRLSDLFAMIWPMIAAREGRTHAHAGVKRDDRTAVTLQAPTPLPRYLAYACQVFDVPVPDLFLREKDPGGLALTALSEMEAGKVKAVFPSLLAGNDALARQSDASLVFRAARAAARARPEHVLASVLPSGGGLRSAVFGALQLTHPEIGVPAESKETAAAYAQEIQRYLTPPRLEQLRAVTTRLLEGGPLDTRAWLEGVAYTVTRAGFLLTDGLETATRVLSTEGDDGVTVSSKDRIKDLLGFSVSPGYFRLRKELGLSR
jgi:hypothetical protein